MVFLSEEKDPPITLEDFLEIAKLVVKHSDGRAELICQKSYEDFVSDKHFIILDGKKASQDTEQYMVMGACHGWETALGSFIVGITIVTDVYGLRKSREAIKEPLRQLCQKVNLQDKRVLDLVG